MAIFILTYLCEYDGEDLYGEELPPLMICITTIPSRIHICKNIIDSLTIGQKRRPLKLIVSLPNEYDRFPGKKIEVPDFMQSNPYVEILRVEKDYGPATKFLGPLLYDDIPPNTTLIVTDDDTIKKAEWTEYLEQELMKNPGTVITLSEHQDGEIHGGRGFAFRRNTFNVTDLLTEFEKRPDCRYVDDDFLTHYCRVHNIPIIKAARSDLHIGETDEFRDKLKTAKGKLSNGQEMQRKKLRKPCADSFQQKSL